MKILLYLSIFILGFGLGGLFAAKTLKPVRVVEPVYVEREVNAMLL